MTIKTKEINPIKRWPRDITCLTRKVEPDLVFIGGVMAVDGNDNVVGVGNVQEQARYALNKFKECVEQAGGTMDDVVEVESLHTDVRHIPAVLEVAKEFFKRSKPTWSATGVSGLFYPEADVCFKGMAVLNAKTKDINPGLEWYAKPPWDVAVPCKVANDLVIVGQACPVDEKGNIIAPGDIMGQNRYALEKIAECIKEAGGTFENVVDLLGYTRDRRHQLAQCTAMWEAAVKDPKAGIRRQEKTNYTAISMSGFFDPGILATIRAYGVITDEPQVVLGEWVGWERFYPADFIPAATKVGRYVFFSGEVLFDPLFFESTFESPMPSIKEQARYALNDYKRILNTIGVTMDNVVWIQPFAATWCQEPILEVAHEFFHNEKVAWTATGNTGLFLPQHLCEIYGMAIVEK